MGDRLQVCRQCAVSGSSKGAFVIARTCLALFELDCRPIPEAERVGPTLQFVKTRAAQSVAETMVLDGTATMLGREPAIDGVSFTTAAWSQIECAWWRDQSDEGDMTPNPIPLRFLVTGFRSGDPPVVDVEVYPGVEDWGPGVT